MAGKPSTFMKSTWRNARTIFRSIRCEPIPGYVTNGSGSHSVAAMSRVAGPRTASLPEHPATFAATALQRNSFIRTDKSGAEVDGRHGRAGQLS
ncbi:MAG: hypothetical protein JWP25_6458 [Bradyrhizobium sp.]|jgi:hypothetical protein|nr:hypothetical protein [Bradyrhizobium sp.]